MKILWCGAFPDTQCGYGRVTYELLKRTKHEIIIFGIYPRSRNHLLRKKYVEKHFIIENAVDEIEEDFGIKKLPLVIKKYNPDIIFMYNDPWVLYHYTKTAREVFTGIIISYIDICYSHNIKKHMKSIIDNTDVFLTFAQFGKNELLQHNCSKPIHILNHGINRNDFYNVNIDTAKQHFSLSSYSFIILNGNRNQPRKRLDITIKAFALFISRNPDVKSILVLNSRNNDKMGWNYDNLIYNEFHYKYKIKNYMEYFLILDKNKQAQGLSEQELNLLYNACDIGINTSDSEGFGLVNVEHASVGKPQIVGKFGGLGEIFEDENASISIMPHNTFYNDRYLDGVGGMGWTLDYKKVADAIEFYYNNPEIREKHGKKIKEMIHRKYNWTDISIKFDQFIQ